MRLRDSLSDVIRTTGMRRVAGSCFRVAADREAVGSRHHHVEQHEIRLLVRHHLQRLGAVDRAADKVAVGRQQPRNQRAVRVEIVYTRMRAVAWPGARPLRVSVTAAASTDFG